MEILKQIWLNLSDLLRQAAQLPGSMASAVKHRKLRAIANLQEVERLDRIRNPSKYRGK